jgi:hypothetical protein
LLRGPPRGLLDGEGLVALVVGHVYLHGSPAQEQANYYERRSYNP